MGGCWEERVVPMRIRQVMVLSAELSGQKGFMAHGIAQLFMALS